MFKLNEYLNALGLNEENPTPSLEFLSKIISKHLSTFKYQNTDLYNQGLKPVAERTIQSINLDDVFRQIVTERRPGYCFQNNELLFGALVNIGFKVNRHLARVYNQDLASIDFESIDQKPFDHELLSVELDGSLFYIDTGFANNSLRDPLACQQGETVNGQDYYRLSQHQSDWLLEVRIKEGKWLCLYKIKAEPCSMEDALVANQRLFTDPAVVPIRDNFLKMALVTETKRKFLVSFKNGGAFFKSYKDGELYRERELADSTAIQHEAERKFQIST